MKLNLTATGLTGAQWIKRLEKGKCEISSYAKDILLSEQFNKYISKKGTKFKVEIVPHKEIFESYGATAEIKEWAQEKGYTLPSPEIALLVREALSDAEMEAMGIWYVAALHEPITDRGGDPSVLSASRYDDGRWLDAYWGRPSSEWGTDGASALLVPASAQTSDTQSSSDTLSLAARVESLEERLDALSEWAKSVSSFK